MTEPNKHMNDVESLAIDISKANDGIYGVNYTKIAEVLKSKGWIKIGAVEATGFNDWFNDDDHDLYNYPEEAMETCWNAAIDALKKQGYVKLDDLIEKVEKEKLDTNNPSSVYSLIVEDWLKQQKADQNEIIESVAMKICEIECDHVGLTSHESTYHRGMNRDVYTDCAKAAIYAYLTKLIEKYEDEITRFELTGDSSIRQRHTVETLKAEQKLMEEG